MLIEAGLQLATARQVVFEELVFRRLGTKAPTLLVAARSIGPNSWELSASAEASEGEQVLATGRLSAADSARAPTTDNWKAGLAGAFEAACQAQGADNAAARVSGIARFAVDTAGTAEVGGLSVETLAVEAASILYSLCWERDESPLEQRNATGSFIVVSDDMEAGERLADGLRTSGQHVTVIASTTSLIAQPQGSIESVVYLLAARRCQPESAAELLSRELEPL